MNDLFTEVETESLDYMKGLATNSNIVDPVYTKNLEGTYDCPHDEKTFKTLTWLKKHIREKHDSSQTVSFGSPEDVKDYVGSLFTPLEGSPATTQPILEPDIKIPFKITEDQATSFVRSFNVFMDNLISMMIALDIIHYGSMTKESTKAMGNAISIYIDHSGMRVTPFMFLMWNMFMIYGSVTMSLPKTIRKERLLIEEAKEAKLKRTQASKDSQKP